ncbi:YtzI protein [Bacillus salitolerans]|uniref:YtzI protein n=1 Tax=Bacillus salitolerans TaxID=1437434 RepID=A0ABW4LVS8_9BACI
MFTVLIISIIVVIIVLLLSVLTINKGYAYKQTIDQLEDNPYIDHSEVEEKEHNK